MSTRTLQIMSVLLNILIENQFINSNLFCHFWCFPADAPGCLSQFVNTPLTVISVCFHEWTELNTSVSREEAEVRKHDIYLILFVKARHTHPAGFKRGDEGPYLVEGNAKSQWKGQEDKRGHLNLPQIFLYTHKYYRSCVLSVPLTNILSSIPSHCCKLRKSHYHLL